MLSQTSKRNSKEVPSVSTPLVIESCKIGEEKTKMQKAKVRKVPGVLHAHQEKCAGLLLEVKVKLELVDSDLEIQEISLLGCDSESESESESGTTKTRESVYFIGIQSMASMDQYIQRK